MRRILHRRIAWEGFCTESFSCMHVTGGQEVSELCSMVISCFKLQDIRHLGKAGRPYPTVMLNRQPEPGDRPPSQVKANPQGQRIVFTLYLWCQPNVLKFMWRMLYCKLFGCARVLCCGHLLCQLICFYLTRKNETHKGECRFKFVSLWKNHWLLNRVKAESISLFCFFKT